MRKNFKKIGAAVLSLAMVASILPTLGTNSKAAEAPGAYRYFDDYTVGYSGGIKIYTKGSTVAKTVQQAGVTSYPNRDDRPFKSELNQAWDEPNLVLTQPVKFTDNNGVSHDIEGMLTNFNFIADPTAIDNSDVDGKLYVYGTTEAFSYKGDNVDLQADEVNYPEDQMLGNKYANHSLTILSTEDMVNWTDEGFMDTKNLTNLPSDEEADFVGTEFTGGNTWAPSGLKIDGDKDGEDEYYLFYTNGGSTGYVMSDTPVGPWKDPINKALCDHKLPNCSDCNTCFDPGVVADPETRTGYVFFGGLTRQSSRVVQIGFEEGTGEVELLGDPVKLATHAFFEDSEVNKFGDRYYFSYCSDFNSQSLTDRGSICVYVGDDPLSIAFDPTQRPKGQELEAFEDETGYHRFLGTVLKNTSTLYGESYNNHHHMQEFKGHTYIFYHSTVLNNTIYRHGGRYRNFHVDEIVVDTENEKITCEQSFEGPEQLEAFNPYVDNKGVAKEINATTTSFSAGVKSRRADERVKAGLSPMVLDEIDTGDWTKIQGVDFGTIGANKFEATVASETDEASIEIFLDDPTKPENYVTTLPVKSTGSQETFKTYSVDIAEKIEGKHDVFFVFRGTDYDVAAWKFSDGVTGVPVATPTPAPAASATPAPAASATPAPTAPAFDYTKNYTVGKSVVKVAEDGTAAYVAPSKKTATSATIPATVKVEGKSYKVTSIATNAFKNCKKLKKVTIGKNIKTIGANAFNNCKALKTVTVKSTVLKKVGKNAFKGTNAKLTVKVPKKKLKAYKKLFKKTGMGKKARVK